MPDVSVIIPVFNRAITAEKAVASVLAQENVALELIVIDDGSSDGLTSLEEQLRTCPEAFLLRTQRQGVAAARNAGIERANGKWIAFLDSDDYWQPGKLERQLAFHEKNPAVLASQVEEVWYRSGKRVNKKNIYLQPEGDVFASCLERCCISPSSVLLHKEVLKQTGAFSEELPACEDYELWLRVASQYEVGFVGGGLVVRQGGAADQLSQRFAAMDRFRVYSILKVLCSDFLDEDQEERALEELVRKLEIIKVGGMKRGTELGSFAESVLRSLVEVNLTGGQAIDLFSSAMQTLHDSWKSEFQEFLSASGSR